MLVNDKSFFRPYWYFLAVLAAFTAFAFQGTRGLYESTEGRYAECAREMVETGGYLQPTLDHHPHWTKPPLAYWGIAAGVKVFGLNAWGARLFNGVAFFMTVFAVAAIGRRFWGERAGLLAGFIYATSLFPVAAASAVSADTLLTFWETLAVLGYIRALQAADEGRCRLCTTMMWAAFGLGFLTKGPPVLLPLIPIWIWHKLRKRPFPLFMPAGVGIFLLIALPWYLAMLWQHPELASYWFKHELVERMASDTFHRNPRWYHPFILYLPALGFGAGAWHVWSGIALWRMKWRPAELWRRVKEGGPAALLLMWLAIPLAVFFAAQSRLPLYVLPIYPPITLALAWVIERGMEGRWREGLRKAACFAAAMALLVVALKLGYGMRESRKDMGQLYAAVRRADPCVSEVWLMEENRLYGLEFYLDGHLRHLTLSGQEEWSDGRLRDEMEAMKNLPASRRPLIVVETDKRAPVIREIRESGMNCDVVLDGYWAILRLTDTGQTESGAGAEAPASP